MLLSLILLACSTDLLVALLLCLVPFLLGWLAAHSFYNVGPLRTSVANLTTENGALNAKVNDLTADLTDVRVKHAQLDAELHDKIAQLYKVKNDLIIAEAERNAFRGRLQEMGVDVGTDGRIGVDNPAPTPTEPTFISFLDKRWQTNDLKIVEGIGPKIAEVLNNAGINTWKQLSETSADRIREILDAAGSQFNIADPTTWPEQARMADAGDWEGLKTYQAALNAGRVD